MLLRIVIGGKQQPGKRGELEGALKFALCGQSISACQSLERRGTGKVITGQIGADVGELAKQADHRKLVEFEPLQGQA